MTVSLQGCDEEKNVEFCRESGNDWHVFTGQVQTRCSSVQTGRIQAQASEADLPKSTAVQQMISMKTESRFVRRPSGTTESASLSATVLIALALPLSARQAQQDPSLP